MSRKLPASSGSTWLASIGGCLVAGLLVAGCLAALLVAYWQRGFLRGLVAPSEPPTIPPPVTVTALSPSATYTPTHTPYPTVTPTPNRSAIFGDPILAGIAGRSPDFQDDFNSPASGWEIGRRDDLYMHGTMQYLDGEYVFVLDPVWPEQIEDQGPGAFNYLWGSNSALVPLLDDYVLEIDQTWVSGSGFTMVYLCGGEDCYTIRIQAPGFRGGFWQENFNDGEAVRIFSDELFVQNPPPFGEPMRITFVKRGPEIALYANGEAYYYLDLGNREPLQFDFIHLRVLSDTLSVDTEIHWDNLKIWDLGR